jgi:hypothetical protein
MLPSQASTLDSSRETLRIFNNQLVFNPGNGGHGGS